MVGNRVDVLTRDELRTLVSRSAGPSVSIYMPAHRAGRAIRQDPIRLKNLLEEAEERLVAGGLRAPEARGLLGPGRKLLDDGMFWQYQSDGLAIFLSAETFRFYRLPFDFEELVVVADRFHMSEGRCLKGVLSDIPKMKTHKATAKRFKVTSKWKLRRLKQRRSHLRRKKSKRVVCSLDKDQPVGKADRKRVRRLLGGLRQRSQV
jgi:ribosomal protein L35